ncbi:GNAT family N-acetyltransferase [Streptomyces sp. 4N509B]|uniref:GNAT family N-acetyltransferase n=1 Tax=Streptomyces sp. 4N509B TaxID=3457413 RepID=UPI003FCFB29B
MSKSEFSIRALSAPYDDPETLELLKALDSENAATYGEPDREPVERTDFSPPNGLFLVGIEQGRAVACGAFRLRMDIRPGATDAEIKRMYVTPEARGRGYGARILEELEAAAAEVGASRAILETGIRSVAAFSLYRSRGYEVIPLFSDAYADSPTNRALGKPLKVHAQD